MWHTEVLLFFLTKRKTQIISLPPNSFPELRKNAFYLTASVATHVSLSNSAIAIIVLQGYSVLGCVHGSMQRAMYMYLFLSVNQQLKKLIHYITYSQLAK